MHPAELGVDVAGKEPLRAVRIPTLLSQSFSEEHRLCRALALCSPCRSFGTAAACLNHRFDGAGLAKKRGHEAAYVLDFGSSRKERKTHRLLQVQGASTSRAVS